MAQRAYELNGEKCFATQLSVISDKPMEEESNVDDELRADLGVSRENLAAYDPAGSVYKSGRQWSYTTLGGNHAGSYDTKREALEAAVRHKELKQAQFDNPSGYRDIVSVRARKSLALIQKYQDQGMSEIEAGAKARSLRA